jgi:protein subunit release factor B
MYWGTHLWKLAFAVTATARAAGINIPTGGSSRRRCRIRYIVTDNSQSNGNSRQLFDNTTMRSCGARGQNINRAVPLGIPRKLQVNAKQGVDLETIKGTHNYQHLPRNNQELEKNQGDQVETSWRAQIRKYFLNPYKLIKDQRTNWMTSDTQEFLDGELEYCITAHQASMEQESAMMQDNQGRVEG